MEFELILIWKLKIWIWILKIGFLRVWLEFKILKLNFIWEFYFYFALENLKMDFGFENEVWVWKSNLMLNLNLSLKFILEFKYNFNFLRTKWNLLKKKKKYFVITSTKLMDLAQTKGQEYIMNICKILRPNEITNDIAQELRSNIRFQLRNMHHFPI